MRILAITNFYPPTAGGGYGEICADMMAGLVSRGHEVEILIGIDGAAQAAYDERGVRVKASLETVLAAWRKPLRALRAVAHDDKVMREVIDDFQPDVAVIWHMRGLMKTSLRLLEERGVPLVYMLHDRWVLYERPGPWLGIWQRLDRLGAQAPRALLGRLIRRPELRAPRIERRGAVCFGSGWLQQEHKDLGFYPRRGQLLTCGVDVQRFSNLRTERAAFPPRKALFAGRIDPTKGLHVAIEALERGPRELTLTVTWPTCDQEYLDSLRARVAAGPLRDRVEWLGEVSRDEVANQLASNDLLLYPSIGVEAGSLGLLEAFAAGIVPVTSAPGGPREYLDADRNCVLFEPGDAAAMQRGIERLCSDQKYFEQLLAGGQETAERFSLESVIGELEELLVVQTAL